MPQDKHFSYWIIIISFIAAFILTILPLPLWANPYRPAWILMVVIYWSMHVPHRVGLTTAFCCGLILDALNGNTLGEHSAGLLVLSYICAKIHMQFRFYPALQQSLAVFVMTVLYQWLIVLMRGVIGEPYNFHIFWFPAIATMLLWPWVSLILRDSALKSVRR